ncbi:arrestin domain-containing protein 4 isoform X2 [Oryzias melastigma]|uniref:arrestin domain-containing protein 4 isoform X2 n=1 Tax=Oryzias melastigma TaxID=30732 RepID=UPI000CF7F2EF|nr:arrestin domain-containing protein 4 isoform X2 [Oryzias melastigma]
MTSKNGRQPQRGDRRSLRDQGILLLGNNTVSKGSHVYPFTFQIPTEERPSSFRGAFGKIVYRVEANLSRSKRKDKKAKAEFIVINKGQRDPALMSPQQGMVNTKKKVMSSGTITMDVKIPKTGFYQGEGINVVGYIHNKSSRDVTPKYCLYMKCCGFVLMRRKMEKRTILKEEGEVIPPSAGATVKKTINIPPMTGMSILNCGILTVEYRLKCYVDVKFGGGPEFKFNIVVLPVTEGSEEEKTSAYDGSDMLPVSFMSEGGSLFQ